MGLLKKKELSFDEYKHILESSGNTEKCKGTLNGIALTDRSVKLRIPDEGRRRT